MNSVNQFDSVRSISPSNTSPCCTSANSAYTISAISAIDERTRNGPAGPNSHPARRSRTELASIRPCIDVFMADLSQAHGVRLLPRVHCAVALAYARRCDSGSAAPDFTSPSEKLVWMSLTLGSLNSVSRAQRE